MPGVSDWGRSPAYGLAATLSGMRMKLIALVGAALLLTGCSANVSGTAKTACVDEAEAEVGATLNTGGLETTNMGDALYEAGITDERDTNEESALYTVAGDVTYQDGGKEIRKSMICTVKFEDGAVSSTDMNLN